MLTDMHAVLGNREAAVARELTKYFEEVRRGDLATLAAHYTEHGPPKGEIVVVIGPPEEGSGAVDEATVDRALAVAMERMSVRDAASEVAAETGWPRRQVYARALELGRAARIHRRPMVRMMAVKQADPRRLAAWRRGRWSEALCRLALRLKGYRILARGWRCQQGEIDIVARRGGTVAIVEVKARRTLDAAGSAPVTPPASEAGARRRDLHCPASRLDRPARPVRHDAGDARPLAAPSGGCMAGRFPLNRTATGQLRHKVVDPRPNMLYVRLNHR